MFRPQGSVGLGGRRRLEIWRCYGHDSFPFVSPAMTQRKSRNVKHAMMFSCEGHALGVEGN